MMRWLVVALLLLTGDVAWAQTGPQTGGAGGSVVFSVPGAAGPVTATAVTVGVISGSLNAAGSFNNFGRVCVDSTQGSGIWVNWSASAATQGPPSEHIAAGMCIVWVKQNGYLPTNQWNAISDTASSTIATVMGN